MAQGKIPDPLTRRHWLTGAMDAARALAVAEAYLAEDRSFEALAFLEKAGASDRIAGLRDEAAASGDVFLLRAACESLGEEPGSALWEQAATAAEAGGKEQYAAEARRQLGAGGA